MTRKLGGIVEIKYKINKYMAWGGLPMLKACVSLADCERVLIEGIQKVRFIGEIQLSAEDVQKITNLITCTLTPDPGIGFKQLGENAPAVTSVFLVWQGITGYEEGDYWTSVLETAGLKGSKWQERFGKIFIDFLKSMGLPRIHIRGALPFVSPILLHGGVPKSCLNQFFEYVIWDLIESDLTSNNEVKDYLYSLRKDEQIRTALEEKHRNLKARKLEYSNEVKSLESLMDLLQQSQKLTATIGNIDEWIHIPKHYEVFRFEQLVKIEDINIKILTLREDEKVCLGKISGFTQEHEVVLQLASEIFELEKDLETVLRGKVELPLLQANEANCLLKLGEYAEQIKAGISPDDFLYVDEQRYSQGTKSNVNISLWIGLSFLPVVLYVWYMLRDSLLGLVFSMLLGFTGVILLSFGTYRLYRAYKRNKSGDTYHNKALTLTHYREILVRKTKLQKLISEWEDKLNNLLLRVNLPGLRCEDKGENQGDILKSSVKCLQEKLEDAIIRKKDSSSAKIQLRDYIQPELSRLNNEIEETGAHIKRLDEVVTKLGHGNFDTGIENLKSKYLALRKLEEIKEDILSLGKGFFLSGVEKCNIQDVIDLHRMKLEDIREITESLKATKSRLAQYPEAYPYIDEPIRRFIIYGDEWVEEWIVGCIKLVKYIRKKESIPRNSITGLPFRVFQEFKNWWNLREITLQDKGFSYRQITEHSFKPKIWLDPTYGDIKIIIGSQRFKLEYADGALSFSFLLTAPSHPGWSKRIFVGARKSKIPGFAETDRCECVLPALDEVCSPNGITVFPDTRYLLDLAKDYEITFFIDDNPYETRTINVFNNKMPCLIFHEYGELIQSEFLPRAKVWFIFPVGWGFLKRVPVIGDFTPSHFAHACSLFLADLTLENEVSIGDGTGSEFKFSTSADIIPELRLAGGELVHNVLADGNPLYIDRPPCLEIPLSDPEKIGIWDILIRDGWDPLSEPKKFGICELMEMTGVGIDGGRIGIPLGLPQLLGFSPIGKYSVYAIQRDGRRLKFSFQFTVIPDFWYQFEPSVLFPAKNDESQVKLLISVFENATFSVNPPAKVLSEEDGEYQLLVDVKEDTVEGQLSFLTENFTTYIQINIPKIRWKLNQSREDVGTGWVDTVKEVFIDDLSLPHPLFLQLNLPIYVKRLSFSLENKQNVQADVKEGNIQVDLMQFMDTLKITGPVGIITGKAFDSFGKLIGEGPILSLRWQWEIKDLLFKKEKTPGKWCLGFKWKEKGYAKDRIIRVWSMYTPWQKPVVWNIPKGETCLAVNLDETLFPEGPYLVKFDTFNKWSSIDEESKFPKDQFNTFVIHLHGKDPYIKEWNICWAHDYKAIITGSVVNVSPGTDITVGLYGIRKGKACLWESWGTIDSAGRFTVSVKSKHKDIPAQKKTSRTRYQITTKDRDTLKNSARWIGIVIKSEPEAYLFAILPEPGEIEWWFAPESISPYVINRSLACPQEQAPGKESFPIPGNPIIRIKCEEGFLDQPDLSEGDSKKVIKAWLDNVGKVGIPLRIGEAKDNAVILWSDCKDELCISLSTGRVLCTTCNAIVESQQAWQTYHSKCKSLIPEKKGFTGSLFIVDNPLTAVCVKLSEYLLAEYYPLTIYPNIAYRVLPTELLFTDNSLHLTELVGLLVSLEERLVLALSRGEKGYEHESN